MTEKQRGIDAVLVHVYGYHKDRPEVRPDIRGRLQVSAARQLQKLGVEKFVVAVGEMEMHGKKLPPLAVVTGRELTRRLSLDEDTVAIMPTRLKQVDGKPEETQVKDTLGEIEAMEQVAEERGWENLASLANRTHTIRIRQLWGHEGNNASVLTMEDILSSIPNKRNAKRYKKVLRKLNWSLGEILFILQEIPKIVLSIHPVGARLLQNTAEKLRKKPGILID